MINRIVISSILVLFSTMAFAQIDRSTAPEPMPAKEIQLGEPSTFTLKNGLKVFVVENHKLPRVSFSLILDKDPSLEGDKTGYVSMAGQMLMKGTENRSKAELDQEIDFIGASLSTSARGMYASSLTKHTDKLLELMTDVLYNPAFPEEELEKLKKQTLSGLAASKDDPGAIASNLASRLVYGEDHPYGEFETEASVENISIEDCKNYYDKFFRPNIGYLAIVGDISPKEAKKLVKKNFQQWEESEIPSYEYTDPQQPDETFVALYDRAASVQSVINVSYPVELETGSEDVLKARVLNQILGGGFSSRLMQNLREDKAFTYGARSSLSSDELVGRFNASASVRNEVTDSAVNEFMYELKKIVDEGVTQKELDAAKASIAGSFARSLESPQTIASFAINTARFNLPEDYYSNYLKNLEAVTVEDIKATADKYIKPENAYIIIVGKGDEIADKLERFGEVRYFDRYGKEYDPSNTEALPAGLTAEKVFEKYVDAIGGREKLESVDNVKMNYEASMQGQTIGISFVKNNIGSRTAISLGAMTMQEIVFDGDELSVIAQGNKVPVPESMQGDAVIDAQVFPELNYADIGVEAELIKIVDLDGNKAYQVDITLPSGRTTSNFYDVETGLKVKEQSTQKTPRGEMTTSTEFKDYTERKGIKVPATMTMNQGMGPMKAELKSIEFDVELEDNAFKVN